MFIIYLLALALLCSPVLAETPAARVPAASGTSLTPVQALALLRQRLQEDTEAGLIISQIITIPGHDFFQQFVNLWRDKEQAERYNLTLRERASARFGSEVWIEYRGRPVYRTRLPTSRAAIRQVAEEAVEAGYLALQQADAGREIGDADVARDEL